MSSDSDLNGLYNSGSFGWWSHKHRQRRGSADVSSMSSTLAEFVSCYGSAGINQFEELRKHMQSSAATTSEVLAYSPLPVAPAGSSKSSIEEITRIQQPCYGCTQSYIEMLLKLFRSACGEFVTSLSVCLLACFHSLYI